ncbi:MAG: histidinol-phosphatase HisJ family protein [Clostridium sp.]|uniref:histidinol-phosphatase HisJ family protein n=1 Tax=Clostridium sp. TaxID=1506 RepID=UPI002FCA48AD
MFDTHIHTNHSSDSKMHIEEVIKVIENKGIGVILTEHLDINYPDKTMFRLDIEKYFREYEKYRSDKLLLGIEIGFDTGSLSKECLKISEENPFDYVLGSTHIVNGIDLYEKDFYESESGEVYNIDRVYSEYFEAMLKQIRENPYFDSLGHIDYISRYAKRHYNDAEIYYDRYSLEIDKVLREIISMDKSIEINTRRFGDSTAVKNLYNIYSAYKKLGGKYVTIGSDSHTSDTIGYEYRGASIMASEIGLNPIYYKNRKMIKI